MASQRQIDFFDQLLGERDFGDLDLDELREKFADQNQSSASEWIERALQRNKLDDSQGGADAPPF